MSSNMRLFASSSIDSSINVYNYINGKLFRKFEHPNKFPISNVNYNLII